MNFVSCVAALVLVTPSFARAEVPQPSVTTAQKFQYFERGLMGTKFIIICCGSSEENAGNAAEAAFGVAAKINQAASDYIADSELLSISSKPAGQETVVSPLLFQLLWQAREFAENTDGIFDPTVGPLTQLWRESRRSKSLPAPGALVAARAATDWRSLILHKENLSVTLAKPGMRLDLGGCAKGQTADAMYDVLLNYDIPSSCVIAGGDIRLGDAPPGSPGWKVGIRTFSRAENANTLTLEKCGVSTAGDLQQFVEIRGVRYSHIIDLKTGLGMTQRSAATVVAPNASISDLLDTVCCVATPAKAKELCRKFHATVHLAVPKK